MPHLKAITRLRIRRLDVDPLNARVGRTPVQLFNELLNGMLVAFEMRLDAPVGSIADPADDPERPRPLGGPGTEEDALDSAGRADFAGNAHRQRPSFNG
jgi:hypothetical protein